MQTTLQPEGQHEELLTITEAAKFLNVKVSKIRREVFLKRIKHFKLGALLRFKKSHLSEWVNSQFQDSRNSVAEYQIQ
ncbi:MAG: helix-turn-helix domain-containing protein [Bacteriovoracaceae bacterium]|nr:helix-turn-helix domain-containing protein [Bacteriovoracaceae bacterium]